MDNLVTSLIESLGRDAIGTYSVIRALQKNDIATGAMRGFAIEHIKIILQCFEEQYTTIDDVYKPYSDKTVMEETTPMWVKQQTTLLWRIYHQKRNWIHGRASKAGFVFQMTEIPQSLIIQRDGFCMFMCDLLREEDPARQVRIILERLQEFSRYMSGRALKKVHDRTRQALLYTLRVWQEEMNKLASLLVKIKEKKELEPWERSSIYEELEEALFME